MEHMTVFHRPGRYAGWPANSGIWTFPGQAGGMEVVVGFNEGAYQADAPGMHPLSRDGFRTWGQARSIDSGSTWTVEDDAFITTPDLSEETLCPGDVPFTAPGFALRFVRTGDGDGAASWFYLSEDRCRTWQGQYRFPSFEQRGVVARTDYHVLGERELVAVMAAQRGDGKASWAFCTHTADGGATWTHRSWIGPEPIQGRSYMPSTVVLPDGRFLTALRRKEPDRVFIDLYESADAGMMWMHVCEPVEDLGGHNGNPPALALLRDGRLALTYAWRGDEPSLRAKISADDGRTWSAYRVLRTAPGVDLGYSRSVQRPDGRMLTCYYYNSADYPERSIQATIWDVDAD